MATDYSAIVTALNPFCRFRADNTTTVSFKVTEWTDMSSVNAGHKLTQATAGKQLTGPIATSSLLNNRALALFTGTQQYDSNLSAASWNSFHQDHVRAWYHIGVSVVNGGYQNHFGTKDGGTATGFFAFSDPTGILTHDIGNSATGDNTLSTPSAFANNAPFWTAYRSDKTLTPDMSYASLGKTTATGDYTIALSTGAPATTFHIGNATDTFSLAEVIGLDFYPTTSQHNAILAYITWWYNLVTGVNPGDVTAIQARLTTAASGALTIPGTVAASQSGQTVAATGALAIPGTVAAVQAGEVFSAVQATSIAGAVAALQSGQTVAAAGSEKITGTAALVQAGEAYFATAGAFNTGTVAATQSGQAVAAVGQVTIAGTAGPVVALDLTANQPPSTLASTPVFLQTGAAPWTIIVTPTQASAVSHAGPVGAQENIFQFSSGYSMALGGAFGVAQLYIDSAMGFSLSSSLAWSAGAPLTITVDQAHALVTLSGFTSGNGTYSTNDGTHGTMPAWTWPAGALKVGQSIAGDNTFGGAFSNVSVSGGGMAQPGLTFSASGLPLSINGTAALVQAPLTYLGAPPGPPAAPNSGAFVGTGYTAPRVY